MKGFRLGLVLIMLTAGLLTGCASSSVGSSEDVQTSSDLTETHKRASLRLQLAIGYFEQKQWNVALDETKQAISIDPNYADAYSVRGLIYMQMNEARLAEDNFLQALKLSPKNPDYSNNYGWFLCQNGREQESIPYFEAAFNNRKYQSPTTAFNNAGICSLKMKQDMQAMQYFSRAFQIDANHPLTNAYLAKMNLDSRDNERARFYLNRLNKIDAIPADALLVGIRVARKLGDRASELSLVTQLRRRYANSPEYSAYQREVLHGR